MGRVNFDTTVNKRVNIDKDVRVNVDKDVRTDVDLNGSLASAEASADAVGGGGGGGGSAVLEFLLDDFSDLQTTIVDTDNPTNTGTAPGVNVPPPINDPTRPDGVAFTETDISQASALRTFDLFLFDAPNATGQATLGSGVGGADTGTFSNDSGTASNQRVIWETEGGADPFAVVLPGSVFSATNNLLIVEDIVFNPGDSAGGPGSATERIEIEFEDADGTTESAAVFFTDNPAFGGPFVDGQDFVIPLENLIDPSITIPAGTVLAPGIVNVSADPGNPDLDLENLVRIELRVLDNPDPDMGFGSFDNPGLIDGEVVSIGGTDISAGEFRFVSEVDEDVFNIAETETFAQVTEDGAFSFSDALAATNFRQLDDIL